MSRVDPPDSPASVGPAPRRGRITKGDWTLILCAVVGAGAAALSVLGLASPAGLLGYVAVAGAIGAVTNRIAITMLFDPWPSRRVRLPYTGLIELERERIVEALADAAAETLLRPEELAAEMTRGGQLQSLRDEAVEAMHAWARREQAGEGPAPAGTQAVAAYVTEALSRAAGNPELVGALGERLHETVEETLDSEQTFRMIRSRFMRMSGTLGVIGHMTGVADYDEVTYRILDSLREELSGLLRDRERLGAMLSQWAARIARSERPELRTELAGVLRGEMSRAVHAAAEALGRWDIENSPAVANLAARIAGRLDVRRIVREALGKLPTSEIRDLVRRSSRHHLAWLEVWGGLIGAISGAAAWAVGYLT